MNTLLHVLQQYFFLLRYAMLCKSLWIDCELCRLNYLLHLYICINMLFSSVFFIILLYLNVSLRIHSNKTLKLYSLELQMQITFICFNLNGLYHCIFRSFYFIYDVSWNVLFEFLLSVVICFFVRYSFEIYIYVYIYTRTKVNK